jgi:hypothetical protein
MKERLVLILIILTTLVCLSSCASSQGKFDPNFEVAVMCSSNETENTDIAYLDKDLKVVHQVFGLKYSGFAMPGSPVVVKNGIMYGAPEGTMYDGDARVTVATDLKTGSIKEYKNTAKLAGPIQIAVNDKAYFVCTNLNGTSTVGRHDFKTGKEISSSYNVKNDMCVMNIAATDDYVFCGGEVGNSKKQYIYELDADTLKMCRKIEVPYYAEYFSIYGNTLYFPLQSGDASVKDGYICEYNIKSNKLKLVPLYFKNETREIMKQGSKLYIVDADYRGGTTKVSRIIVYDTVTHKFSYIRFGDDILQAVMKNGFLYIFGDAKYERGTLYKCKVNDDAIKIVKQRKVTKDVLNGDYAQSIFVK